MNSGGARAGMSSSALINTYDCSSPNTLNVFHFLSSPNSTASLHVHMFQLPAPNNPFIQLSSHSELKLFALTNWRGSRGAQGLETTDGLRCGADVTAYCICICITLQRPPRRATVLLAYLPLPSSSIFPFFPFLSSHLKPSKSHLQLISSLKRSHKSSIGEIQ
jgi:hypothetical protein